MVGKEINASNLLNDCDTFGRVLMHQMPGAAAIIITLGEHGVLLIERLMNNSHIFDSRDWSPKFETGLNIITGIVQKVEE